MIDSNSAGDSFVGGFFAKIILILEERKKLGLSNDLIFSTEELKHAVHAGNIIALQVLQRYGCTFPEHGEMKKIIDKLSYEEFMKT